MKTPVSTDSLEALSYMFAPPPEPGRAMARLEVVTPGGGTFLSMPDIRVTYLNGHCIATVRADGNLWAGEGDSQTAAVIALLADRAGYHAAVTMKEGDDD